MLFGLEPDAREIYEFGSPTQHVIPDQFNFVLWNIYKERLPGFWDESRKLIRDYADIFAIQEAWATSQAVSEWVHWPFEYKLGSQFLKSGFPSGPMTGSKVSASLVKSGRTTIKEPIVGTPKTWLKTVYPTLGGEITVLNIHGLNFTNFGNWISQINEFFGEIPATGPVIVAGDFNSKNPERVAHLEQQAHLAGLSLAINAKYQGKDKILDWVFFRDLTVDDANFIDVPNASDHLMLYVTFKQ